MADDQKSSPQDTQQARERLAALERRDQLDQLIVEAEQKLAGLKDERKTVQASIDGGASSKAGAKA